MNLRKITALLLAAVMVLGLLTACGANEPADPTAASEETTATEPTTPFNDGSDVTALSSYSITEAAPHDAVMSAVIAVDADGNPVMTNSTLQMAYWLEFFNFMAQYGSYASYFGLDPSLPLSEQPSMAENRSWEQYFLESATQGYAQQYALYRAALAEGYTLTEEEQATLDDILDPNGSLARGAAESGFDTAEEYLQDTFGPGVDLQDYYDYVEIYITGNSYYSSLMEKATAEAENADEATLSAYYDDHADAFAENKVQKVNNVSVRHILITPEGEKDPTTGDYTAEAWTAAQEAANEIYAQWQNDPTEDNFAALANEKSTDPGSNTNGGLYEDFDSATMVEEFTEWSFDPARTYGDSGIVKTSYGYHIMFFVGQTETKGWMESVRAQMPQETVMAMIDEICAANPLTFDYTQMRVFDISTLAEVPEESTAVPEESAVIPEESTVSNG